MASLLVKESPPKLNDWLKEEARLNRRSLSQQILVCLEWCMNTFGEAQYRNPFASALPGDSASPKAFGAELAKRMAAHAFIGDETAKQMSHDAKALRKTKDRSFAHACFD